MRRPNILLMCTDQQRWDTLGCYGNAWVRTPAIDSLARDSVLFEHAYCQSPVCTPSRASILTGRYPRTTRTRQNGQNIPDDEVLVTRMFADAGYTCGLAGKLHVSACSPAAVPLIERRIDDGYAVFRWSHHPAPRDGTANWPTNAYDIWLHEHGVEFQTRPFRGSAHVQHGMSAPYHHTTWCAQEAVSFIETGAVYGRPWLFSANLFDPHFPFDPPPEYLERYLERLDELPLPNTVPGELEHKPRFQQQAFETGVGQGDWRAQQMTPSEQRLVRAAYWAMCDLIDAAVGRMLDALRRTGQHEHTLVVFMSDHGELLGDHGLYLKGPYFYEGAIRVPLLMSWPGVIPAGRRIRALTELVDVAPTLLEVAGLAPHPGMQGRSLWPLIMGHTDHGRADVYCEYLNAMPDHLDPRAYVTMVRTDRYKLTLAHGLGDGELYDLSDDPFELENHWHDPRYAPIKVQLLQRLCDRIAWTMDPLPPRLAPY